MSRPVDRVLERLPDAKPSGRDRWRTWCRACGGNTSALSIGLGADDTVLLKCWKGCSVEEVLGAIGLEMHDLFPERLTGSPPMRRRGLLSAVQALNLLHDEVQLIALAGSNIAHGVELTDADRDRVLQAAGRIAYLRDGVRS